MSPRRRRPGHPTRSGPGELLHCAPRNVTPRRVPLPHSPPLVFSTSALYVSCSRSAPARAVTPARAVSAPIAVRVARGRSNWPAVRVEAIQTSPHKGQVNSSPTVCLPWAEAARAASRACGIAPPWPRPPCTPPIQPRLRDRRRAASPPSSGVTAVGCCVHGLGSPPSLFRRTSTLRGVHRTGPLLSHRWRRTHGGRIPCGAGVPRGVNVPFGRSGHDLSCRSCSPPRWRPARAATR